MMVTAQGRGLLIRMTALPTGVQGTGTGKGGAQGQLASSERRDSGLKRSSTDDGSSSGFVLEGSDGNLAGCGSSAGDCCSGARGGVAHSGGNHWRCPLERGGRSGVMSCEVTIRPGMIKSTQSTDDCGKMKSVVNERRSRVMVPRKGSLTMANLKNLIIAKDSCTVAKRALARCCRPRGEMQNRGHQHSFVLQRGVNLLCSIGPIHWEHPFTGPLTSHSRNICWASTKSN
jgi:hypothetical protein